MITYECCYANSLNYGLSGIYFLYDRLSIVYVGKSDTDIRSRLKSHISNTDMIFDNFSYILLKDNRVIKQLESLLIAIYTPKYNKRYNNPNVDEIDLTHIMNIIYKNHNEIVEDLTKITNNIYIYSELIKLCMEHIDDRLNTLIYKDTLEENDLIKTMRNLIYNYKKVCGNDYIKFVFIYRYEWIINYFVREPNTLLKSDTLMRVYDKDINEYVNSQIRNRV